MSVMMNFCQRYLGSGKPCSSKQVSQTDLEASQSDLDCSALIQTFESDDDTSQFHTGTLGKSHATTSDPATNSVDSQHLINQQILSQLQSIGERFDKIENKFVKKTSDPTKNFSSEEQSLDSRPQEGD